MKKSFSAFILAFSLSAICFAQPKNNFINDAVMPAPNAAALGKYGDIPVSTFTGTPNISIPLYTLKEGPLELPISLNYHSSGVKVGETASWVGLGWSLQAGGIITRTVIGLPDDKDFVGYLYTTFSQDTNFALIDQLLADNEPDLFTYNVNGYIGKFVMNKAGECLQLKKSDVRIQALGIANSPSDLHFLIITPDGTRYLFQGVKERTRVWSPPYNLQNQEYNSTWYLSSMSSSNQQHTINFTYTDEFYGMTSISGGNDYTYVMNNTGLQPLPDFNPSYYLTTEVLGKKLASITGTTSSIIFFAGYREDIEANLSNNQNTAGRLDSIQIEEGGFCKRFTFSYDYFADNVSQGPFHKQLKLLQLQERSCNGSIQVPPHVFTYEGPFVNGKQFLPNRRSRAMDHWGFYNGAHGNDNMTFFAGRSVLDLSQFGMGFRVFDGGAIGSRMKPS